MLDIKFIRQNLEAVKRGAEKKHIKVDLERLLKLDDERRILRKKVDDLRAERNRLAKERGKIEEGKIIKEELKNTQAKLLKIEQEFDELMLQVPQIPDESVPEGTSDADNKPIRFWGKIPKFDFLPNDHIQLARDLDLIDFERGAKVSGFRGYFLKNEGLLLEMALWRLAIGHLIKKGFVPMSAPALVREFSFMGTGWLPQGKDDIYETRDNLFLAGTAEVPAMGYYADEILTEEQLPIKIVAFSPCFRTEAGSYGKDTKGIYRLHEFKKIEQVILCRQDKEESVKWHEEITKNAEEILQMLGLPYRVVINCGADLGLGQVKKYDIETWVPSQAKYRETHSSSYFYDFQTRRLGIRYRAKDGKLYFAHSLNNTAIATPRIFIQILENYQQKDGSVVIPKVLQEYVRRDTIMPKK